MKKIIWVIIIIVILAGGCWYGTQIWWSKKQLKIQLGLAEPDFPWWDYTQEELDKLYPQIRYADVPTRVTPEETYAKFREALRTNNLELAIEQLSEESERYDKNKEAIEKAYEEKKLSSIFKEYPENIEKEYMYEAMAQFYFLENDGSRYPIDFLKDVNGDWKMDSL